MKKYNLKTRLQWGWFKAALFGAAIAILIAPAAQGAFGTDNKESSKEENPIRSFLSSISFGNKVKVMINGETVALAKSEEAAREAFWAARLAYNADGIKILDIDVSYEAVDKEKDRDSLEGMRLLRDEKLSEAILASFDKYRDADKDLAYTMRIDDYTVTVDTMEDLVSILEQAQSKYDVDDSFQVELNPPASRNVTMYEVGISQKTQGLDVDMPAEEDAAAAAQEPDQEAENLRTGEQIAGNQDDRAVHRIFPTKTALTGETTSEASVNDNDQEGQDEGGASGEQDSQDEGGTSGGQDSQDGESGSEETVNPDSEETTKTLGQAAEDGIKYVGFSDTIQVMETYVDKSQIRDKETAYNEITAENQEASIYVVQPGDSLSVIAEKNNLTVEEIKEMNPGIENDDNLYYDDRLNITVPRAAVQILVEKQETYEENYYADTVYEDDADMYIGETEIVQEGAPGTHIVTDLVTYKDDLECGREQLEETVEVAAVAQIVKRGTKSKPTYMYPVTNWTITSTFGTRWGRLHAGVDVGVPVGTTVRASRGGQVVTAGWVGGYGNCVMIDHGDGIVTLYGHLSEFTVSVGQYVDQGTQVALSGNTGRSTGPHLHFEIRVNGSATDPLPYLYGTE